MRKGKRKMETATPSEVSTVRRKLAKHIARDVARRDLTQTEAARLMMDAPSQVSLIVNGKLEGFSMERLLRMVAALGNDVVLNIVKAKTKHGRVRLLA